ncbi:hypothetical protein VUJ46_00975 [Chryseobacterium sp. MYb264]|uniref:hypothetical protein n=1 Tax=Chryseobacterium sp. MYb264 TaxID=2745153 RepID=UPI002E114D18|nr:hypothetical protein VUJ46_00975 [Chryseobacterium sp. MYb264]
MPRGILNIKLKPSKSYTIRDAYIEISNINTDIEAYIDKECMSREAVDYQGNFPAVKWIVVEEIIWNKMVAEYNKENKTNTYGNEDIFSKIQPYILFSFSGNTVHFNLDMISNELTAGNIYLLMPYTYYPERKFASQNLQLVYIKAPHIRYAYIKPPSANEADFPPGYNSKLHLYGMSAKVNISNHLLPDFRKQAIDSTKTCNIRGEVFFMNEDNEEVVLDSFMETIDATSYNSYKEFDLFINPEWRDLGTHQKPNQSQKYYIKLQAYITNRDFSVAQNPELNNPVDYETRLKDMLVSGTYNTYTDFQQWRMFNAQTGQWEDLPMQPFIEVRFDTMEMIYRRIEIEKTNMIQYIGDIKYLHKENDPCGYSKITIQDDDEERDKFILFNEDATDKIIDKTDNVFAIIAGDKTRNITIVLYNLKTKGVFCQGLLLEDGQKHDDKKNVFQVDKVFAAKRGKNGYYTEKDNTHQEQLKNAGLYSDSRKNENDYDVIKTDQSYNPSQAQKWTEGIDYEFESDHRLKLMLHYFYNKTYESALQKILGYTVDAIHSTAYMNMQSTAWVARYIFMKEAHKQSYFVPISTCRYPNQIAKIEVYPDFEWWINVKYETDSPLAVAQATNYQKRLFTTERNQNQRVEGARRSEHSKNWKLRDKKYELGIDAGYKLNGEEHSLSLGDGFPLFQAISFFLKTYELVRALSFADEAEDTEQSIGIGTERASDGREPERRMTQRWRQRKAKNLPFRVELSMPSFSGGIYGKFTQSKKMPNNIGSFYNLAFAAKPLFAVKGELDLLYYAQFIGPIGQAMHRISQVVKKVNYLTLGAVRIDYFIYIGFTVDVNVELKALEYHSIDGWDGGEIQVDLPITIYIRSGIDINVSIQGVGSGKAEGKIEGEMKLESRITYDKRENKGPALLKFNGLSAKIWVKLKASTNNSDEESSEPDEEPDYIRSIIDPKDPWEINIFNKDN